MLLPFFRFAITKATIPEIRPMTGNNKANDPIKPIVVRFVCP